MKHDYAKRDYLQQIEYHNTIMTITVSALAALAIAASLALIWFGFALN